MPVITTYARNELNFNGKGVGVPWASHIIYIIFALFTFYYEYILQENTLKRIKHLMPEMQLSKG